MPNIKVNISVEFTETEEPVTQNDGTERLEDGSFKLVMDHTSEFDIDRLENAALKTCYPALRAALSEHLEHASKKKPAKHSN